VQNNLNLAYDSVRIEKIKKKILAYSSVTTSGGQDNLVKNLCKFFIPRFRVEDSNLLGGIKK